jgi:mono/diheme cytochrome c family protein
VPLREQHLTTASEPTVAPRHPVGSMMENPPPAQRLVSTMIKKAVNILLILVGAGVILGAIVVLVVLPRLDWSATAKPPVIEKRLAGLIMDRWVRLSAPVENNPMAASAENLKLGQQEFEEHCAVCHAADGSAQNLLGADFYPPIPRLERGSSGSSDGELYFIIANGIRYTGMPGFGTHHDPDDIWRMILWIRHLPHLSAAEKAELLKHSAGLIEHEEHEEGAEH